MCFYIKFPCATAPKCPYASPPAGYRASSCLKNCNWAKAHGAACGSEGRYGQGRKISRRGIYCRGCLFDNENAQGGDRGSAKRRVERQVERQMEWYREDMVVVVEIMDRRGWKGLRGEYEGGVNEECLRAVGEVGFSELFDLEQLRREKERREKKRIVKESGTEKEMERENRERNIARVQRKEQDREMEKENGRSKKDEFRKKLERTRERNRIQRYIRENKNEDGEKGRQRER